MRHYYVAGLNGSTCQIIRHSHSACYNVSQKSHNPLRVPQLGKVGLNSACAALRKLCIEFNVPCHWFPVDCDVVPDGPWHGWNTRLLFASCSLPITEALSCTDAVVNRLFLGDYRVGYAIRWTLVQPRCPVHGRKLEPLAFKLFTLWHKGHSWYNSVGQKGVIITKTESLLVYRNKDTHINHRAGFWALWSEAKGRVFTPNEVKLFYLRISVEWNS